jgi:hypothetical protein
MFKANDFIYPDRLCITDAIDPGPAGIMRHEFDYADPNGFALCEVEQQYYENAGLHIDAGFENKVKQSAEHLSFDLDDKNESKNTDWFHISHSYTQFRSNFKGDARSKWGVTCRLYAKSKDDALFEFVNLEYEFSDMSSLRSSTNAIESVIVGNDNLFDKAEEMYDRKQEWDLLGLFDQREWKTKFLFGWDTHYKQVPSLIL